MSIIAKNQSEVVDLIKNRKTRISVIGLGKMGLPIALTFTHAGFRVDGCDLSQSLVGKLNEGKIETTEPFVQERLSAAIKGEKFQAHTSLKDATSSSDFIIVIIPIVTDSKGNVVLEPLIALYQNLVKIVRNNFIIIQESTLPPGTTKNVLLPLITTPGKMDGRDFGIVFAPERTYASRVIEDIENNYPKIIGGTSENAAFAVKVLYEEVARKGVIKVSDATTAEAVKTFKGTFRDINIAIANQFAILADKLGLDILEIIKAANTEPFSTIHTPGIGVGGHCIPVYPHFLIQEAKKNNYNLSISTAARNANDFMAEYAIEKIKEVAPDLNRNILILGISYRGQVKEHRNSPVLHVVSHLKALNLTNYRVLDPYYSSEEVSEIFHNDIAFNGDRTNWEETLVEALNWSSIVIIINDHEDFKKIDYRSLSNKIVYDGRYIINENLAKDFFLLQPGRMKYSK